MYLVYLVATHALVSVDSKLCAQSPGSSPTSISETNAAVEKELSKVLADDDAAQAEVDKWTRDNTEAAAKGSGLSEAELKQRIDKRFEPVRKAYEDFLARHPKHARAHLAFGNFLNDRQDETGARQQWEKVVELDPKNAVAYNNLAGAYSEGETGKKALEYFAKAIELDPSEASFYHNFANTVYVLRKTAMNYYHLNEQEVYAKALGLYSNAVRLDPKNFSFAWDFAQTYYMLNPLPTEPALQAWTNALAIAPEESDRQGVALHLARVKMLAGRLSEARAHLATVTQPKYAEMKTRLLRGIEEREKAGASEKASERGEKR